MKKITRTLVAHPDKPRCRQLAETCGSGHEVIRVHSVLEAKAAPGKFDRALVAFDFEDGSGILLAASLLTEGRVDDVTFVLPGCRSTVAPT